MGSFESVGVGRARGGQFVKRGIKQVKLVERLIVCLGTSLIGFKLASVA